MAKPPQPFKGVPAPDAGEDSNTAGQCRRRAVLLALAVCAAGGAAPAPRAALLAFTLVDTSLQGAMQGARADEQARLVGLDGQLRDLLAGSGRCVPVDIAPVADAAAGIDPRTCPACARDLARRLGARLVVIPWVQKVSNLILNINVTILDAGSGRVVAGGSVDIRGNTDETWPRGLAYLARERLLAAPWELPS